VATDLLKTLGIKMERLSVGANAGMYSTFQPPTAEQKAVIGRELDAVYADFVQQVGEARKLDPEQVDAAARGRVLTGIDAQRAGLVDEVGGLQLAFSVAKEKAGIASSRPIDVERFPADGDRWQRIADRLVRLAGIASKGPEIRAPREVRELMARFGLSVHRGNVRLPPLPPLWH
jgi:protease-4